MTVTREHVVTDQGNGGAYCSNCLGNLDGERDRLGMSIGAAPNPCPKCGEKWVEGGMYINMGGSDF